MSCSCCHCGYPFDPYGYQFGGDKVLSFPQGSDPCTTCMDGHKIRKQLALAHDPCHHVSEASGCRLLYCIYPACGKCWKYLELHRSVVIEKDILSFSHMVDCHSFLELLTSDDNFSLNRGKIHVIPLSWCDPNITCYAFSWRCYTIFVVNVMMGDTIKM